MATGGSHSIAIGDLNGDGEPELATANNLLGTISVLANRGDGSFRAKRDYATGDAPESIAIGDLNGDGKPELATANSEESTVSVLANATGFCVVPNIRGKTLPAAKRAIVLADCRVGKIGRAYSKTVKRGRVISQKPKLGRVAEARQGQPRRQSRARVAHDKCRCDPAWWESFLLTLSPYCRAAGNGHP